MKAQHTHADRTEWEGTLAEETGCCVAGSNQMQQLQQAVGLTLSSKPFSFTICCAWSAMLEASMPYTCAAPTCSQAGVQQVCGSPTAN